MEGSSVKQVFISHDTESDGPFANKLAKDLEELDIDVWVAPASIHPGEQWIDAMGRGLETSTHFALVSTPNAYQSSWVRKEYNAALLLETDGEIKIIPLEVTATKIPLFLRGFQLISFREAYDAGLRQLADLLGVTEGIDRIRLTAAYASKTELPTESQPAQCRDVRPPAPPVEPAVFLAYDVRDRQYANRLSEYLRSRGVKMWMAPDSIDPGTRWEVAITNAVVDASAMVVVMTPRSSKSQWVQSEILVAVREGIPIFPILREGDPFDSLGRYQFLDARDDEMLPERFVERLKRN